MKYALCKTKLGWAGIGIENGAISAATLPTTRGRALEAMLDIGATEPAGASEAAALLDLVRRAAKGEHVDAKKSVRIQGGTPFQRSVWEAMLEIPYGATVSYRNLAERVGRPLAARAVGQAVGHNPIPLLIPCHRVLASGGGLGGFGGGLPMKQALLKQEGALP